MTLTEHPSVSVTHRERIRTRTVVDSVHVADPGKLTFSLVVVSDRQLVFHVSDQEIVQIFHGTAQKTSLLRLNLIDTNIVEKIAATRIAFRVSVTRNTILGTNT